LYYYLTSLNNISFLFTGSSLSNTALEHIRCESQFFGVFQLCPDGGKVKQIIGIHRLLTGSRDCIRGVTYGIGLKKDKVWVRGGCKAIFTALLDGKCVCSGVIFSKKKINHKLNNLVVKDTICTPLVYMFFFSLIPP
jgi:hypothetical protein